jgi:hypothetical protein
MNMISQGQVAAGQRKLFEGFLAGIAVAAIAIALAWGAFAVANAPKSVAPTGGSVHGLQNRGLLDQRAGERGGAVAIPQDRGLLEQRAGERGGAVAIPAAKGTTMTDSLVEQRALNGASVQTKGTNGFNGFGDTGYRNAMPTLDQSVVEHLRGEHGALR